MVARYVYAMGKVGDQTKDAFLAGRAWDVVVGAGNQFTFALDARLPKTAAICIVTYF